MKYLLISSLMLCCALNAQEKKRTVATFIHKPVTIDARLNEDVYSTATPARNFFQLAPYNGNPAMKNTDVYFFYDNSAIYIGAIIYDNPDSVSNFLSERDNIGNSDYFGVYFDPYNKGLLAYGFFVTPAGVQIDMKAIKSTYDYEDTSWDAVWQSKTSINDQGWVVEMKIPFSELRFAENNRDAWGLNMFRNIRRYNSNNSWSFINRNVSGFIHQQGELAGIENLKPPVRLSLRPYGAAYSEFKEGKKSPAWTYKGGMDLKYGLSESFTLDMMLVPDFGQIQSDDRQLNLSPYELYYAERRQFFNEGTELFNRGGVFYSRRIGAQPKFLGKAYQGLSENEKVIYNPSETQLVNATKISGRTSRGLGLGFLNAMSLPSYATIQDKTTERERKVETQPFTNYNIVVADVSLRNNSYFSLINTNVQMVNNPFSANVTATDFQIRNKDKNLALKGKGGLSVRNDHGSSTGFFAELGFEKNKGSLQYGLSHRMCSDTYNPNDLGFLGRNNEANTRANIDYKILKPFWYIREWHSSLYMNNGRVYKDFKLAGNFYGFNTYGMLKNMHWVQARIHYFHNSYNYYEPRVQNRYFYEPPRFLLYMYYWTNESKPASLHFGAGGMEIPGSDQFARWGNINLRVRWGRRLEVCYGTSVNNEFNNRGFASKHDNNDTIVFARRNVRSVSNVFSTSFIISSNGSLNIRVRHYWSGVVNKNYYTLRENGKLEPFPGYNSNHNTNYNAFNVDVSYRLIFAPGSELTLAWKNSILDWQNVFNQNYWENFRRTLNTEQINSLSVRVIYYLDYNRIRNPK